MITLEKPSIKYIEDFIDMIKEFKEYGDEFQMIEKKFLLMSEKELRDYFPKYIEECYLFEKPETVPMKGWVDAETFFIINDRKMVGELIFRHRLNKFLIKTDGNIGYKIKHSERNKGYATQALKLVLNRAWEIGLNAIMMRCSVDNQASAKVIEKNGGVLIRIEPASWGNKNKLEKEYWIFKKCD